MPAAYRYAIYFAPPSPWRETGSRWLGRCAETGMLLPPAPDADLRQPEWTSEPRRYGLHATLKPPFRLRAGTNAAGLDRAVRELAARMQPFDVRLQCRELRGFLAWCLDGEPHAHACMQALAAEAVRALDDWRAPPTDAELEKRRKVALDPAHEAMLARWGYPYVFEQFVFHITLTGRLQEQAQEDARGLVLAMSEPLLREPMPVRALSVYVQPAPDAPFVVARHYGFDGRVTDGVGAACMEDPGQGSVGASGEIPARNTVRGGAAS